jgi:hypothetical protein
MTNEEIQEYIGIIRPVIEETVNFYFDNPDKRGVNIDPFSRRETCAYLTENGNMCAIGRLLTPECLNTYKDNEDGFSIFFAQGKFIDDVKFKEEYNKIFSEVPIDVVYYLFKWLQDFHDSTMKQIIIERATDKQLQVFRILDRIENELLEESQFLD